MTERDPFTIVRAGQLERSGNWLLARRTLDLASFGLNLVDIEPGERIPEHDESGRDQEEVFVVIAGEATILIDGSEHPLPQGALARLDPQLKRLGDRLNPPERRSDNSRVELILLLVGGSAVAAATMPWRWIPLLSLAIPIVLGLIWYLATAHDRATYQGGDSPAAEAFLPALIAFCLCEFGVAIGAIVNRRRQRARSSR